MIDFSEININDKRLFDHYIGIYKPKGSEFTFTNFFMWRNCYRFRYAQIGEYLCTAAIPVKGRPYVLPPIGKGTSTDFRRVIGELEAYFKEMGWRLVFKKVPEDDLPLFKELGVPDEKIVHDRDNSDYIYFSQDLISLKGKKYDGKRNHINRFKREHSFEYIRLDSGNIGECKRIAEEWCRAREHDCCSGLSCEKDANKELLDNYDALNLRGALIKVDGRFEAFSVGEMLNEDTAVIHIEKANFGINGLYTLINQQFSENEWRGSTYINREQDLGREGLRKAKLSYNPKGFINKYDIIFG